MNWTYNTDIVDTIPEGIYGFIYILTYDDGSMYVGKKQVKSCITLPALRNGTVRDNAKRISKRVPMTKAELANRTNLQMKNRVMSKIQEFDIVCKESKWKSYEGSCKDIGDRKLVSKQILRFCPDKTNLTYWEVACQCKLDVLTDDRYLNENIGGLYYKGKIV